MSLALGFAIYFICWWLTFFAVLPFGVRTQEEEGEVVPGSAASAPAVPHLGRKVLITTLIAGLAFGFIYLVMVYKIIALDDIPFLPRYEDLSGRS